MTVNIEDLPEGMSLPDFITSDLARSVPLFAPSQTIFALHSTHRPISPRVSSPAQSSPPHLSCVVLLRSERALIERG